MKWPRAPILRWVKNLNFGALWGATIFLLYQTMLVYREGAHDPFTTDSPATLAESILKSCLSLEDISLKPAHPGGHVTVLTRRSPRAADLVARVLHQSHSRVLLMSEASIFDSLRSKLSSNDLRSLRFLDIHRQCKVSTLVETLARFHVEQLHILFDEFDFSPLDFASDVGTILRCLIQTFEALSKHEDIPIYLHSSRERFVALYRVVPGYSLANQPDDQLVIQHNTTDGQVLDTGLQYHTREAHIPRNHKINSCDPLYDYDFYHDVFMKSVGIYTKTYRNLYNFHVQNVVD